MNAEACEIAYAIRRYDRGIDAAHLANTPVVSPESKNPARAGVFVIFRLSLFVAAEWRSSAKHEGII